MSGSTLARHIDSVPLIDTGFSSGVADLDALAGLSADACTRSIVRLESVAEEAIAAADDYATAFARLLEERGQGAQRSISAIVAAQGLAGRIGRIWATCAFHPSAGAAGASSYSSCRRHHSYGGPCG